MIAPSTFFRFTAVAAFSAAIVTTSSAVFAAPWASVDRQKVEVGETITYSLHLDQSGQADIGTTPGFRVVGTSQSVVMGTGGFEETINYTLLATDVGKFNLGPSSVISPNARVQTKAIRVEVVPSTGQHKQPLRHPRNPFFPPDDFDDLLPQPAPHPIAPDDPLADGAQVPADHPDLFLRAVTTKQTLVVGEPLLAKWFVYFRGVNLANPQAEKVPTFADFFRLEVDDSRIAAHAIEIDGAQYRYAPTMESILFPAKSGKLRIDPATIRLIVNGIRQQSIDSNSLDITVTEPDPRGRPPDYVIGNCATDFTLDADLSPRDSRDGHSVLILRLTGRGRLDTFEPILPNVDGVSYTLTGNDTKLEAKGEVPFGRRTLTYDIAFAKQADFDLDNVRMPYWDYEKHAYDVGLAHLGRVHVSLTSAQASPNTLASAASSFALPPARTEIAPASMRRSFAHSPWPYAAIVGMPFFVLAGQGAGAVFSRLRQKAKAAAKTPSSLAKSALKKAKDFDKKSQPAQALAEMNRAIELAIEASTGVKIRGLTARELDDALAQTSLETVAATELKELLEALDLARFSGLDAKSTLLPRVSAWVGKLVA